MRGSVPAREFGHINSHPPVMGEAKDRLFAEQSSGDGRGSESPRVGISTELEAGNEKAKTDTGLGADDQRKLRDCVWSTASRHCDPD